MKTTTLLVLCIISFSLSYGQAVITKPTTPASVKTIANFGAVANDGLDDTWAFIKAGKYFSNLWDINGQPTGTPNFNAALYSGELTIPSGIYNVGKQYLLTNACTGGTVTYATIFGLTGLTTASLTVAPGSSYKMGLELITLSNVDQMVVRGTGLTRPLIKYNDSLDIGYFNCNGTPQFFNENGTGNPYSPYYVTTVGNFIQTVGSRNILIENLEVDGNNPTSVTNYNGGWDISLIQAGATAIHNVNTKNVTVKDLNIHNMTLDAVVWHDFYRDTIAFPGQAPSNFLMQNTNCDNNRRQGFSWVGGKNVTVTGCTFNNTGKLFSGISRGNPAAGLDIEPEDDGTNLLLCLDGFFTDCSFINNTGLAMGNDPGYYARTKNMNFTNCVFHDVESYAVLPGGRAFTFNNCKLWGTLLSGGAGFLPGDETIFNSCEFMDKEIVGQPGVYHGGSLIESDGAEKRMRFNSCNFEAIHPAKNLFTLNPNATTEAEFTVFSNCTFTMGVANTATLGNYVAESTFEGNNTFINNNSSYANIISTNGLVFAGSNDPCNPSVFSIKGKIMLWNAISNLSNFPQFVIGRNGIGTSAMDGYVDFVIDNAACLYTSWSQIVDIGKNARLINKSGGQYASLGGTVNNAGKIILDDGSNTSFFYSPVVNTALTGLPEFYYHKNASTTLSTFWGANFPLAGFPNGVAVSTYGFSVNSKVDGGNTLMTGSNAGTVNTALAFSTGTYVIVPAAGTSSKLATFGNNNFSIEVSFKSSAATNSNAQRPFFSQGADFAFGITGLGNFYFKVPIGGGATSTYAISPALTPAAGDCHVAVLTRGSDQLFRLYVDKVLLYTSTHPFPNAVSSNLDSYIGRELLLMSGKTNNFFQGDIGRVRVWNSALSTNDICYNYGRKAPLNAANLVADWDMTDASGTTLTDAAPTPANGTLMGLLVPPPTWVTQNTVGSCVNASGVNNASYINFRRAASAIITVNSRNEAIEAISIVAVSPNPNSGIFTIDANGQTLDNALVQVFNSEGKRVWSKQYKGVNKNFREQVSLSVAPGAYIVKISSADKLYQKKIIIN